MKPVKFSKIQAELVYQYAGWILALVVLITIAAFPLARSLKLRANFMDLLPADTPSIIDMKKLNNQVGGSSYLIAVIESPSEETARVAAENFVSEVKNFPSVGSVDHRTSFPAFENRKLLFLTVESIEKLRKNVQDVIDYHRRKNNPFFIELVEEAAPSIDMNSIELEEKVSRIGGFSSKGKDSYMQAIVIKPKHPMSDFERSEILFKEIYAVFDRIESKYNNASLDMALTGPYKVRYDEYKTIQRDLKVTGVLSAFFIVMIMIVGFRSFRSIIYIYLPLGIALLWTSAFASIAIGYLNLISAFLFGILLGMGIDYAIHLRISLEHNLKESGDLQKAIELTYAEVGKPILTSCLTASIAFFSMTISSFEGLRHFGIIAGSGILLSFLVIMYGMPSLTVIVERFFPAKIHYSNLSIKMKMPKGSKNVILWVCILFSIFSLTQIPRIKFDYNFANLQARDEGVKLAERVYRHFGVELTPASFIAPNRARAIELAERISKYIKTHPESSFDFSASIMSHIPKRQLEKIALLAQIDALIEKRKALIPNLDPDTQRQIKELREKLFPKEFGIQDLPAGLFTQYENKDRNVSVVYVFPKESILDGQVAKRFVTELRNFPVESDITLAGEPVIYADILILLERDMPRAMALSFFMVVLVLFVHFKRPLHVMWVLLPVVIAFLWMVGMTSATNFKFNYLNLAILPSILGAGIDNGIYIYHAYRNKGDHSIIAALRNTGKGVILASLTAIAAFTSMLFARHVGMASMGKLGFFGFTSVFLASIIFFPALIQLFENRRKNNQDGEESLAFAASSKSSSLYKT